MVVDVELSDKTVQHSNPKVSKLGTYETVIIFIKKVNITIF